MELYDGDGDDLDEDMEESNGSNEESNNENPEEQNDQPPTETEVPVASLRENPLIGNRDLKLVRELFQKIEDVKLHCSLQQH